MYDQRDQDKRLAQALYAVHHLQEMAEANRRKIRAAEIRRQSTFFDLAFTDNQDVA